MKRNGGGPIYVVGPSILSRFWEEYDHIEDFGLDQIKFLTSSDFLDDTQQEAQSAADLYQNTYLQKLQTVRVQHCFESYAVVMDFKNSSRVAFSGDCRPSAEFAKAGLGADLLIHEATFNDELLQEAIKKNHCTISEAVRVAKK